MPIAQNDVKPLTQKDEYRRLLQTIATPSDLFALVAEFSDLLDWWKGEDKIIQGPVANATASQTVNANVPQPADGFEWEVIFIEVHDNARIDGADQLVFSVFDPLANDYIPLSPLQGLSAQQVITPTLTKSYAVWPTNTANVGQLSTLTMPIRIRNGVLTASGVGQRSIVVTYKATATVGTRQIFVNVYFRERRIG